MAERRMIAKSIIDSDDFLEMPMSARLLYYDLNVRADDDGFIDSPKKIVRMIGASDDDLKRLEDNRYIIRFEDKGVVVIRHWLIHNYIRKDRYHRTNYVDKLDSLFLSSNNEYMTMDEREQLVNQRSTNGQPTCDVGKARQDKIRSEKIIIGKSQNGQHTLKERITDSAYSTLNEVYQDVDILIASAQSEIELYDHEINDAFGFVVDYANNNNWTRKR